MNTGPDVLKIVFLRPRDCMRRKSLKYSFVDISVSKKLD
jgi:hypothetical protein